jgi:glycosyltransferase involved in cell wall biosynthesis
MRVAFVTPRYGEEIVGGAEAAMRMIAERLVSQLGWSVEAITTCASDYMSWDNDLPPGESELNGVRVRRFPVSHRRSLEFDLLTEQILPAPHRASLADSDRWVDLQGPRSPELLDALAASDADVVSFSPYLYYPTVWGIPLVARRSIFHPAAHDEAPIYLPSFRETFASAAGFVFNAAWERSFVQQLFNVAGRPQLTLGLGVDDPPDGVVPPGAYIELPAVAALSGRPYLSCVGRVDSGGKGTTRLVEMFSAYKAQNPGPLALALVGPVIIAPPEHPDVFVLGQVTENVKWSVIDASIALVAPSWFESFNIALMEAWSRGRPAIVNGHCAATSEQCELSGAGLTYLDDQDFERVVNRLLEDEDLRGELGRRGSSYVDANFRWPGLIERWGRFAEEVAERGAAVHQVRRKPA